MTDQSGDLISDSVIFADKEVLRPAFVPERLPHREAQIRGLANVLSAALKGETPSNVLIYGETGTGKTSTVKYVSRDGLKLTLTGQLVNPIRWFSSIESCLDSGIDTFIEIGPGRVLSGLVTRIAGKNKKDVSIFNTNGLDNIEDLLSKLQERGLLG